MKALARITCLQSCTFWTTFFSRLLVLLLCYILLVSHHRHVLNMLQSFPLWLAQHCLQSRVCQESCQISVLIFKVETWIKLDAVKPANILAWFEQFSQIWQKTDRFDIFPQNYSMSLQVLERSKQEPGGFSHRGEVFYYDWASIKYLDSFYFRKGKCDFELKTNMTKITPIEDEKVKLKCLIKLCRQLEQFDALQWITKQNILMFLVQI